MHCPKPVGNWLVDFWEGGGGVEKEFGDYDNVWFRTIRERAVRLNDKAIWPAERFAVLCQKPRQKERLSHRFAMKNLPIASWRGQDIEYRKNTRCTGIRRADHRRYQGFPNCPTSDLDRFHVKCI